MVLAAMEHTNIDGQLEEYRIEGKVRVLDRYKCYFTHTAASFHPGTRQTTQNLPADGK
jgi:hypothetical protein